MNGNLFFGAWFSYANGLTTFQHYGAFFNSSLAFVIANALSRIERSPAASNLASYSDFGSTTDGGTLGTQYEADLPALGNALAQ